MYILCTSIFFHFEETWNSRGFFRPVQNSDNHNKWSKSETEWTRTYVWLPSAMKIFLWSFRAGKRSCLFYLPEVYLTFFFFFLNKNNSVPGNDYRVFQTFVNIIKILYFIQIFKFYISLHFLTNINKSYCLFFRTVRIKKINK